MQAPSGRLHACPISLTEAMGVGIRAVHCQTVFIADRGKICLTITSYEFPLIARTWIIRPPIPGKGIGREGIGTG